MLVYGLDFTSVPTGKNPITCSHCRLEDDFLIVTDLIAINDWKEFENFLNHNGPWISGIDFPFGQPIKLINNLNWPNPWERYVNHVLSMSKKEFEACLTNYKDSMPYGDKEHRRVTDVRAGSLSPMKLYGVPVGKMFFQGAPRLLKSSANIIPCRRTESDRIVIEAYPGLVARYLIGRESYKGENGDQSKKLAARENIILKLERDVNFKERYSFNIGIETKYRDKCIADQGGDWIDAILCAVQTGWAYSLRSNNYGVTLDCDINEGWITDPSTLIDPKLNVF